MRLLRLPLACLSLAVCACATSRPSPDALRVERLELEGNRALSTAELTRRLVTNDPPFWVRWFPFLGNEWFDANAWQADLRRITRIYERNGYFQARVVEDLVTETESRGVRLKVKVEEGKPALLRTLEVTGLEVVGERASSLRSKVPLTLGTVFLEDDWAQAKAELVSGLHEAGFAEAKVTGEAVVDADTPAVDAKLETQPGQRFTFGQIFAPTGAVVPAKLIIDMAQPELPRGAWYSDSALLAAQARVFQMGVFGAVKVTRGIPDRESGEMPIVIDAREAPMRSYRVGGGGGGDLFRNEVRLFGEYTNRNLGFARLLTDSALLDRLTLRGRLGVAILPNIIEFIPRVIQQDPVKIGPVFDASAQYEVPRAFGTRTVSIIANLGVNRVLDAAFDYVGTEAKLGVVWRPRVDVSVVPSVNVNGYLLASPIQQSSQSTTVSAAVGCPVAQGTFTFDDLCLIGFLDLTAEWDRRDSKLEPKNGFSMVASAQVGLSRQVGSVVPFIKALPEVRGTVSFGDDDRFTLSGKVRAGVLVGVGGDTPIVARFFSGGSYMRGFNQRRLSPMALASPTNLAGQATCQLGEPGCEAVAVPIGGNGLLEASVELRIALGELFVLAFFTDTGMVTRDPRFWLTFGDDFFTAVGTGVRIRTPVGPIRLDVGFRLPFIGKSQLPQGGVTGQPACFFWGEPVKSGAPEGACTVHLSIGEAF